MERENLNICINSKDKKNFEDFCSNISTDMFIKTVVKEQRLPFEIKEDKITEKLKEVELEITNISRRYSKEEIIESINNIIG